MDARPFFVQGAWISSGLVREVINPFTNAPTASYHQATREHIDQAIEGAAAAFEQTRHLQAFERAEILARIAASIDRKKEEYARLITEETGKPISLARGEVARSIFTFTVASEETKRIEGAVLPLDLNAQSARRFALVNRFPRGPVAAISPFNFPLNLVAHKVGPALAVGNTVVLKPSSNAPGVALRLAETIAETRLPVGALSVVPCRGNEGEQLVADERIKLVSFTGSPAVGWPLKAKAGKKKVVLELGGNAGVIVEPDCKLENAVAKIIAGGFSNAGQSCISVQRIYVHQSVWTRFEELLLEGVDRLKVGDPFDEATVVGPMITEEAARNVEAWIQAAAEEGARVVRGGKRSGAILQPTVLYHVRPDLDVSSQEVFAPVVTVEPYIDFSDAIRRVNHSSFGLQAGLFSNTMDKILLAYNEVEVGGLIINDVPTYRIDHMPYGGVKDSGFGREGIKYAMEEMTEMKLLALSPP